LEVLYEILAWAFTAIVLMLFFAFSPLTFFLVLFGGFLGVVLLFWDLIPRSPYVAVMVAFFAGFVLCLLTNKYISKYMSFFVTWIKVKFTKQKYKSDRSDPTV